MKNILQSYTTPELRKFVSAHNKKVRALVNEEVKDIRRKMKAKRVINIVKKKRDEIIDIMVDNKRFFKDIKMKVSNAEQEKKEIQQFEKELEKELKDPKVYNELFGDLTKTESDKKVKSFVKVNLDKLEKSGVIKIDKEKAKKAGVKLVRNLKPKKKPKNLKIKS